MKRYKTVLSLAGMLLAFASCAPKVSTNLSKNHPPLDYREEVRVFALKDPAPADAEVIGSVKIGDTGFSTNCGLDVVLEKAKAEARKAGGNAIKITSHKTPSAFGSSCHRITADILIVTGLEAPEEFVDVSLIGADYALLHIYRQGGAGALVNYDVHLGDSVICRARNNWKETIIIRKEGPQILWARTEAKAELPLSIAFGKAYYVRCGIGMGAFVGRPRLDHVDPGTGKLEFQSVKGKDDNK